VSLPLAAGRFVARETMISAAVNAMLSAGFFFAVFGGSSAARVWGAGGLALDFLPQSFAVAFFATLMPSLLARRAMRQGRLVGPSRTRAGLASLLAVAILSGLVASLVGGGTWAAAFWASGLAAVPAVPALLVKVAYGAILGALVTRHHLQRLLIGGRA
jgi:hypothetical protein